VRKLSVLVAVAPDPLGRIVEHLLDSEPRFRLAGRLAQGQDLVRHSQRAAPDIVVANRRFLGKDHARVVNDLGRSSPAARILLLHPYAMPRSLGGAHVHLDEQAVVRRLLGALHALAGGACGPDPRSPSGEVGAATSS
jgi:hypothetical protein